MLSIATCICALSADLFPSISDTCVFLHMSSANTRRFAFCFGTYSGWLNDMWECWSAPPGAAGAAGARGRRGRRGRRGGHQILIIN
jgi:hypothetical protein